MRPPLPRRALLLATILAIIIGLAACTSSGGPSSGTSAPQAAPSLITWPFHTDHDQWAIVNGYRGEVDHHPGGSPNNYALYAFDFARCLPNNVTHTAGSPAACDLSHGWANSVGAPVYAPVTGTVVWPDEPCQGLSRGLSIEIAGHPGFRIALFHIDPLPGTTWGQLAAARTKVHQGDKIGTVSTGGCIGMGNHIHMALYSCTACTHDPAEQRTGHPFSSPWSIGNCPFPDDTHTANQYLGTLVPCATPQAPATTGGPFPIPTPSLAQGTTIYTYTGHSNKIRVLAWSPNGTRLATGSDDGTARVWDARTGAHAVIYRGHTSYVEGVAWSPDGTRIASGSADGTVQIWNPTTGRRLFTYSQGAWVNRIAWSPDGRSIASGDQSSLPGHPVTIQVWNATTGARLVTYRGHTNGVFAVAWSPDGRYIASDGYDQTLQIWDASTGRTVASYQGTSFYFGLSWSPDSQRVAFGGTDHQVSIFDLASQRVTASYAGHTDYIGDIAWSPDGTAIASGSGDGTVQITSAATGQPLYTYHAQSGHLDAVAWSPDGRLIASGSNDGTVNVWAAT